MRGCASASGCVRPTSSIRRSSGRTRTITTRCGRWRPFTRRAHDYELVLVGDDKGQAGHVASLVREMGLSDSVHQLGFVETEELVALYRGAHSLLYLSFGPENLPPLEAYALGCPVVASDVPGAREQLGEAALLRLANRSSGRRGGGSHAGGRRRACAPRRRRARASCALHCARLRPARLLRSSTTSSMSGDLGPRFDWQRPGCRRCDCHHQAAADRGTARPRCPARTAWRR